jgi:hypothetical protein
MSGVRLRALAGADQADRTGKRDVSAAGLTAMSERDRRRRDEVLEILRADDGLEPADHAAAALVMHHSAELRDLALGHALACAAVAGGDEDAVWLMATSFDRLLHKLGQPQLFGTQTARGVLCRVSGVRLRSVEASEGIDFEIPAGSADLPDGWVGRFAEGDWTRRPIDDRLPASARRACAVEEDD